MSPAAAGAVLGMAFSATRDEAQEWADVAAERGATPDDLAELWAKWEQLEARQVQTVGGAA